MFNTTTPAQATFEEAFVIQVDKKGFCQVRTERGRVLSSVPWIVPVGGSTRGGDRVTPHMGDRVVLNFALGFPFISGTLPRLQGDGEAIPLSIHTGGDAPSTGDYGPSGQIQLDQNQPPDMVQGDRVISSVGGAMVGILRGGSLSLRGGRSADILLNKLHGLVRIFSRNWAHFADACSDVIGNAAGRVFRYTGYTNTYTKGKIEDYNLHFYSGDVAAAETLKADLFNTTTSLPGASNIIHKEQVTNSSHIPIYHTTLNDAGETEIWTNNGAHLTRVTITAEQIKVSWNDQNNVTITEASIHAVHKDGADVIMDSSGVRATMEDSSINLTPGSIVSTNGTGTATVSPAVVSLVNSGHSVTVTPAGVTII